MDEKMLNRIKRLGLNPEDFEPKKESEADRIADLEEAISLLAEVMFGGDE